MTQSPVNKSITIDDLRDMFANIASGARWDMTQPMLWGYFFTHREPSLLEVCAEKLIERGYRFVDVWKSDKDDPDDPDSYWLHVEREEVHTPESLDRRNDELSRFAADHGLDSYDGMDVGSLSENKTPA